MPPVKEDKSATSPMNTSAQIQQIFSEIQSQLPSVNFDNDDHNDHDDDNEAIFESNMSENTDALLESLSLNHHNSFLTLHPKIETPQQQPPSVELQMRSSPNLFENTFQHSDSPPKPSILSMDLFNSIDFDKLPTVISHQELSQPRTIPQTFNRPRPTIHLASASQQTVNVKNRDDRQILERLAQQANKYHHSEKSRVKQEEPSFRNLESALNSTSHLNLDRHGRRIGIPESQRKTVFIDLRHSNSEKSSDEPKSNHPITLTHQQIQSSESESDDDDDDANDGMLWFEKRQQARQQQQLSK